MSRVRRTIIKNGFCVETKIRWLDPYLEFREYRGNDEVVARIIVRTPWEARQIIREAQKILDHWRQESGRDP